MTHSPMDNLYLGNDNTKTNVSPNCQNMPNRKTTQIVGTMIFH